MITLPLPLRVAANLDGAYSPRRGIGHKAVREGRDLGAAPSRVITNCSRCAYLIQLQSFFVQLYLLCFEIALISQLVSIESDRQYDLFRFMLALGSIG
jgi:hypothetical protein